MNLLFKRYKIICLMTTVLIGACTPSAIPVEQIHRAQKLHGESSQIVTKQIENAPEIILYRCDNDKKVEVERQKKTKKSPRKEVITVGFQGTSHKLSSVVTTKNGKKYTNIRWTWHEMRNGKAFLYDNTKKNLAANCVKR